MGPSNSSCTITRTGSYGGFLDNLIPFGEGKQLIVDVPVNPRGVRDIYIDDTVDLTVDIEESNNITWLERAPLLAI